MKWIPVKDRMPKKRNGWTENCLVAVMLPNGKYIILNNNGAGGGLFVPLGDYGHGSNGKITHWMPYPKPPRLSNYKNANGIILSEPGEENRV